jgi:hypothetical protein
MFNHPVVIAALLFSFSLVVQGCAKNVRIPPQNLVIREDHAGLVTYYNEQAQDLREDAKLWDMLAELYERQAEIYGKLEPDQRAVHCRAVAGLYRKAADEATALATEHRQNLPHGVMQ